MGVKIPQPFKTSVSGIGAVGPVSVEGIPDTFHVHIEELPKLQIGLDAVHISIDHLPKVEIATDIRIKEVPSMRTHLPANFTVGLNVWGLEVMSVSLCGEAQMINEPYKPNPCEICGEYHNGVHEPVG